MPEIECGDLVGVEYFRCGSQPFLRLRLASFIVETPNPLLVVRAVAAAQKT
jgi:hypothetical protein